MQDRYSETLALYLALKEGLSVSPDVLETAEGAVFGGYPDDAIGILFTGVNASVPRRVVEMVESNLPLLDDGTGLPEKDFRQAIAAYGVSE